MAAPTAGTARIMLEVALATVPGLLALMYWYGPGVAGSIAWSVVGAVLADGAGSWLRGQSVRRTLADGSATVTGLLLGLALPPALAPELALLGGAVAIGLGKQVYGGLGQNPFNPAMVGYAVLLVSFPLEMTAWPPLRGLEGTVGALAADGLTGATPLDSFKHRDAITVAEWAAATGLGGRAGATGFEWVNLGFLAGGLILLARRRFSWHAPVGMLLGLAIPAALGFDGGSSTSLGSPSFHLLSGATMLAAFFIVTDPVSGAGSARGRLVFGLGVGLITYAIRAFGGYPDGVAFAVLLMNAAAPAIDQLTRPRRPQEAAQ